MTNLLTVRLCASLLALVVFVAPSLAGDVLPVLKTRTETFANVTLINRTATHAFVQHSRGVANVKLVDLDAATLSALGIRSGNGATVSVQGASEPAVALGGSEAGSARRFSGFSTAISTSLTKFFGRLAPDTQASQLPRNLLLAVLGGVAIVFLFFSYCAMLICKKTGQEPGFLIWLPVLQMVPLLRAAGMPVWWLLMMLVPVVNVVAHVLWCLNIAKARGKSMLTAISLILPGLNLFAFIYLAFSRGSGADDDTTSPLGKPLETEPLPA